MSNHKRLNNIVNFLTSDIDESNLTPIQSAKKSVVASLGIAIISANLMLFGGKIISRKLCLIICLLALATFFLSLVCGGIYYNSFINGKYQRTTVTVLEINKSITRQIKSIMAIDENEQRETDYILRDLNYKFRKKHRYSICYHINEEGEKIVIKAKHLGKITREEGTEEDD